MNLDEYKENGMSLYEEFAKVVKRLLQECIEQSSLRPQEIQFRAKSAESLSKKTESTGRLNPSNLEVEIKDLAGCRVIFYSNSDVTNFINSRVIEDNFDVDWERTKVHQPNYDEASPADLFTGFNYAVRLKPQRTSLPEYKKYTGLMCEIQVQTILNHAWSEMAHDTIYKKPVLSGGYGNKMMDAIGGRMANIMRDHLVPAGYEFQKVLEDFERLSRGKEFFDQGALDAISSCDDNNDLFDLLKRYETYVLPNYDGIENDHQSIRAAVAIAVEKARMRTPKRIETPYGIFDGYSSIQIVNIAANILDHISSLNEDSVVATFHTISTLYLSATLDKEKKIWLRSASELSKNRLRIWKVAGPTVQMLLVNCIEELEISQQHKLREFVLEIFRQVLQVEATETVFQHDSVTFQSVAINSSELLIEVRNKSISILQHYFIESSDDADKRIIMQIIGLATMLPMRTYSNELQILVLKDSKEIFQFYLSVTKEQSNQILQTIENDALWLYRRYKDLPDDMNENQSLVKSRDELVGVINSLRDNFDVIEKYSLYKKLAGYQSVLSGDWESDSFSFASRDQYRISQISDLVSQISEENSDEWLGKINVCAEELNVNPYEPNYVGFLLEILATTKPDIAISYISKLHQVTIRYVPDILFGLEKGGKANYVRERIIEWVSSKQLIAQMAEYLNRTEFFDDEFQSSILKAGIETSDYNAVRIMLLALVGRYESNNQHMLDLIIEGVGFLSSNNNFTWLRAMWPSTKLVELLSDFSSEQVDLLLSALVDLNRLDIPSEELLKNIADFWPEKVVDLLGRRIEKDFSSNLESYEPMPYILHSLDKPLQSVPNYMLNVARTWFDIDRTMFRFKGGRIFPAVFKNFESSLEDGLLAVIQNGTVEDIEFVISILECYSFTGVPRYEIFKKMIELLPENSPHLTTISNIMDYTGVLSGEYGLVNALKGKKRQVELWLTEDSKKITAFATKKIIQLDRSIAFEQRRAESDVEMRRRDY